jgi:phospholipid/cholesterol/gamma-HCH transport system permease protein
MSAPGDVSVARLPDASVRVRVAGRWDLHRGLAVPEEVVQAIDGPPRAARLTFDTTELEAWDTSLLVLVEQVLAHCHDGGVPVDTSGLPAGLRRLLTLSEATPGQRPPALPSPPPLLARIGNRAAERWHEFVRFLAFSGELSYSLERFVTHRARVRMIDIVGEVEAAGPRSLSIVAVVNFLLGVILAFVAQVTFQRFGATIYVADAVTVGMVRELGPIMTAVVMAGHSGSAYAAQLGTMTVTQEVDALTTMALPPVDFLVLPRVLALSLMMPLLTVYADFVGIGAGALVVLLSGGSVGQYFHEASTSIKLPLFAICFVKTIVFGAIVAISGCMHGLRASKGAAAVGDAATATVVSSIVWIIAIDGVFAVILYVVKL